jgi:heat shock protein HtpX
MGVIVYRSHNGIKTAALLGLLSAIILLIGWAFGGSAGLILAFVIALGMNAVSYFYSDKIALRSMGARPISEPEAPQLYAIVRELSARANAPMPRLYMSPTPQPNAFATGRSPQHAAVCVTQGIMAMLTPRELRGVLGHELSHVYNRDILISSVAGALGSFITMVAQFAFFFRSSDDEDGPGVVGALMMLILGPMAASLIQLAISRSREYQADESGAKLSDDPLALASALRKISAGTQAMPLSPESPVVTTSHLMIANPFRGRGVSGWFATHPPMPERIARLEAMAANAGPIQYSR